MRTRFPPASGPLGSRAPAPVWFAVSLVVLGCAIGGCGDDTNAGSAGVVPQERTAPDSAGAETDQPKTRVLTAPRQAEYTQGPQRFRDRARRPAVAQLVYLWLKDVGYSSVPLFEVRKDLGTSVRGVYLGHVAAYLSKLGLEPKPVEEPLGSFVGRGRPGLLALHSETAGAPPQDARFVFFRGLVPDDRAEIIDPDRGVRIVPMAKLEEDYHGAAIYLDGTPARSLDAVADIAVEELVFHYGEVPSGTLVRHTFRIRNRGGQPLKIHGIRPSCGCLATPLHRDRNADITKPGGSIKRDEKTGVFEVDFKAIETSAEVPPQSEIFVTGFYDTTNRTGLKPTSFSVLSSDPDEPSIELVVEGKVFPVAVFDPRVAYWDRLRASHGSETLIWLRSAIAGRVVEIEKVESSHEAISFERVDDPDHGAHPVPAEMANHQPKPHPKADGWAAIRVRIPARMKVGPFRAVVAIHTNLSEGPLIYDIWGTIVGNTILRPTGLHFGRVPIGHAASVKTNVSAPGVDGFEIRRAVVSPERLFHVTVVPAAAGSFDVVVSLKKGWQSQTLNGHIEIETNDPTETKKRIPFSGFVARTPPGD